MSLSQALDLAGHLAGANPWFHNFRAACNAPMRLRTHPLQEVSATLAQTDTLVSTNWFRCRDLRCQAALGPLDFLISASEDDGFVMRVCPLCGTTREEVDLGQLIRVHMSLQDEATALASRQP